MSGMKRKIRKNKKTSFIRAYFFLSIIALIITVIGSRLLFAKPKTLHTLAFLPVPTEVSTIYLPGPYEAAEITSPVLGAETINPSDIILYINNERMKKGAPPLRENATLTKAAQMRANVILKYQNFSHQDPFEHIQLDTVLPMVHYPFRWASENIGMGDSSARAFVGGFMSSPSHKANLLNPELTETGVALVTGPYQQYYVNIVVQLFAIPATQEQYLGYRKEDADQYKQGIADLNQQIALTQDRITNHIGDREYYEGWQKVLIRQHQILVTVYNRMRENKPLVQNLISLIQEYNTNWNQVPKG
jgi:uncharacterized protein YkwD